MFFKKRKPNITEKVLLKNGFYPVGERKGLEHYKRIVDIPFSINPFRRVINPNAKDGLVFSATPSPKLTQDMNSKDLLYIVGINVQTSISDDCILINDETLSAALNCAGICYSDHTEYGGYLLKTRSKKQNVQIIKTVRKILKI